MNASAASTVTNPAKATVVNGRFTTTVVLDGGLVTVTPAPSSMQPTRLLGPISADLWATTQIQNFVPQTLGFGIVTITATSKTALPVTQLPAWVAFANGNTKTSTACVKVGKKHPTFRSNGEAAVVIGDAAGSAAAVYLPPRCRPTASLAGVTIPSELVSLAWTQAGPVGAKGFMHFRVSSPTCATLGATAISATPHLLRISIFAQIPDQTTANCQPASTVLGILTGTSTARAKSDRLVHVPLGPVREVA